MFAAAAASCTVAVTAANAPRRASSSSTCTRHQRTTIRTSAITNADTTDNAVMASQTPTIAPFEFATAARCIFGVGTSKRLPALVKELTTLEGCADKPVLVRLARSQGWHFHVILVSSTD
jgi:hypothetical protein